VNFKHIFTNAEYGTGNVREVTTDRRPDVDVKPLARLKGITVDQDEVTLPVVVIAMSIPSLEMRISAYSWSPVWAAGRSPLEA
jgi:hypothetical protein